MEILFIVASMFLLFGFGFCLYGVIGLVLIWLANRKQNQAWERCIREGWIKGPDA